MGRVSMIGAFRRQLAVVAGLAVFWAGLQACGSSDESAGPTDTPDASDLEDGASPVTDAASEWPAPTPPTSRAPCGDGSCWMNAPALSGACGNAKVDEDFSTQLYNSHRFALSAQAGLSVELTLDVTAGSWEPALIVLAADGSTLYDGEIAVVGGPVKIESLASGKTASQAKLRITASADTPLDVFVTAWSVIDGAFAPPMPAEATYTLSKVADCPPSAAVCPVAPENITKFGSGFFTTSDSADPNSPNYSPYKRDTRTEHHGYDIYAPLGTPVVATESGTIVSATTAPASDDLCGKSVNVAADSGVTFRYCHLDAVLVTSGPVQAGQVVGKCGQTGNANSPHLHFTYLDAPNVQGVGTLAAKSVKVNAYIDSLCQ